MTREEAERWMRETCPGGVGHAVAVGLTFHQWQCRACLLDALAASPAQGEAGRVERAIRNLMDEADRMVLAEEDEGRKLPHLRRAIRMVEEFYPPRLPSPAPEPRPDAKCLGCGLPVRECLCRQWTGDSPTLAAPPSEKERTCPECGGLDCTAACQCEACIKWRKEGWGRSPRTPGGGKEG